MADRNIDTAWELNERIQFHLDGTRERWRDVIGYVRQYRVSDLGRVKSLDRTIIGGRGKTAMKLKGKVLKYNPSAMYGTVSLSKKGIEKDCYVHRLVLEAFVGPCPEGMECRHLNGKQRDNRLENLSWGTPERNNQDKKLHGTNVGSKGGCKGKKYARRNRYNLTELDVRVIRSMWSSGLHTIKELAGDYGVTTSHMSAILRRKSWKLV